MILTFFVVLIGLLITYTIIINKKPKNFPRGPLSLPLIGSMYALGTEPHKTLTKMKQKYGKIVGIDFGSFRAVILNDHSVIKEAFNMPEFCFRPHFDCTSTYCPNRNAKGIIWNGGKANEEQRQFMSKALGMGKRSIEVLVLGQLNCLCRDFDTKLDKPVLNKQLFNVAAIRGLWEIMTGIRYEDGDEELTACLNAVNELLAAVSSAGAVYFFPTLSKLFPNASGWNILHRSTKILREFLEKTIESHIKTFEVGIDNPKDVTEHYLEKIANTKDENSSFFGQIGRENLTVTSLDFFIAGTETAATTLTWFMGFLILHPEVQEKMQVEIDKVIGRVTPPSLDDRKKLPYVEACIMEVLRCGSVSPLAAPREVISDVNIQGYFIPKGTIVMPNLYGVLHDPELWNEPENFNPERFLSPDGLSVTRNNALNFVFGSGKRICIGETLAKDELFLLIVGLLQKYTFNIDPSKPLTKIDAHLGTTLVPKPHSMIICKRQ